MTTEHARAVQDYFRESAPKPVRERIENARSGRVLSPSYPYKNDVDKDDPLKQWKLSGIDVEGLSRWKEYAAAIAEMFERLAAIRQLLGRIDCQGKIEAVTHGADDRICGSPAIWDA
jgi:hypothetical protein